ncbi:MAG TPA: serine hydrolase domain-containing protein, partial [Candidatus Limnocylindrales bacterium]|nr:serine hydrolase domain-containing protein [Candidatus Limnocylindrales bacterium]
MTTATPASPTPTVHASKLRADPSRLNEVFDRLGARVATGALPAAAVAIGDADGEIASKIFPAADKPFTRDSAFFLASVTKPIFATAFMTLVEEGRIDLYQPVEGLLPEFTADKDARKAGVTWWHLLTHTSGVPDVSPEVIRRTRPSATRMTEMTLAAPLVSEPGTRYEYCTATFYLLARAMERVSGLTYARYLQERVLDPLGMESTFDARTSRRPIVAVQGVGVENRLVRFLIVRYLAGTALPGGGLFGTLDDLLRFGAAMIRPVDGRVPIN